MTHRRIYDTMNKEDVYYGDNVMIESQDENCIVYKMEDETGNGFMTAYNVFPGIYISYNDFHMTNCISEFETKVEMLGIDHCREGRIEWELQNGTYMYMEGGDIQINSKNNHALDFSFPLKHYHGISIGIHIAEASKSLSSIIEGVTFDLMGIYNKLCCGDTPFIMRAKDSMQHIFSDLYTVPEQIKRDYFKIKVLELLLFLSTVDPDEKSEKRQYYSKKQVNTIKEIMNFMTMDVEKHYTLNQLSAKFDMPLTSMKACFKGVYGVSIYAYMRNYRMQVAAIMIKETNESVTVISGKVGYENSSKFAAAFKEVMNMSPLEYRKKVNI